MDLVAVSDVEDSLARFGWRYLERVFTRAEIAASGDGSDARCLAACFAAKEATLKVLAADDDGLGWSSIEIVIDAHRGASLKLHGSAAAAARRAGITAVEVSVGRTDDYATAVVLAVRCADRSLTIGGGSL